MINLTPEAARQIRSLHAQQADPASLLRVLVETGGCSGFEYGMAFDVRKDGDLEFESEGVKFLIDPASHTYLDRALRRWPARQGFRGAQPQREQHLRLRQIFQLRP